MGRTIMDKGAMAAMEADRVAQAEMREYLERENGPNGGQGPSIATYRREGDIYQAHPQVEAPDSKEGDATTIRPVASTDGEEAPAINADELYKRLQGIPPDSVDRDVSALRPPTPTPSPAVPETPLVAMTEEDMRNYRKASEYGDYHILVSEGARPAYPIERLEAVEQDPDAYFELIYRWSHIESHDRIIGHWEVFQRQFVRWEHFRDWQLRQRGKIDELSLEKFIERRRTIYKRMADHIPEYRMGPIMPERPIPKFVYDNWRLDQQLRRRDWGFVRQEAHKPVDFTNNAEAIRRRLSEHGFTSHIDFDIDPKKQGQLATWAEYVDFELRWLSAYEAAVERAAPEVEKTWKRYHDQGQFSKEETVQVLRSKTFTDKLWREKDQRRMEMTEAREALARLRQQIESDSPDMAGAKLEMLQAAEKRAHDADEDYMLTVGKRAAAAETLNMGSHVKNEGLAAKQKVLAQWAWDQLLLIESENKLIAKTGPVASGKRKARAVKRGPGSTSEITPALKDASARQRSTDTPTMTKGAGLSPERQGSLPPAPNDSVRAGEHKGDGSVSIPSTARRRRARSSALQDATVTQNRTGLSTAITRLGVCSAIREPKQQNDSEFQEASPPLAIKPAAARKRKAESGDLSDPAGRRSKAQKVATQNESRILNQTMTTDSLATLEMEASREKDAPQVPQHDRVPEGENSQEVKSATAKTSLKRKRARTAEEMEASNKRLQSLRKKPPVHYPK